MIYRMFKLEFLVVGMMFFVVYLAVVNNRDNKIELDNQIEIRKTQLSNRLLMEETNRKVDELCRRK